MITLIRPRLDKLFASNALPTDIGDPDTLTPVDPIYPERVANQYDVGWFVTSGTIVKQPHQWINYFYNGVDKGLLDLAAKYNLWSNIIDYEKTAIVYHGQNFFKALVENPVGTPALVSTEWEVCFTTLEEFMILINEVIGSTDGHMVRRDNPHDVTPAQLNIYTENEVDTLVATMTSSVNNHKLDKINPHNVTYTQLGTLPTTGGTFEGPVSIQQIVLNRGLIRLQLSAIRLEAFESRFGLRADTGLNKDSLEVLSFNKYEVIKLRNNQQFTNRAPDVILPLSTDLNFSSGGDIGIEYKGLGYTFTNYLGVVQTLTTDEPGFNLGLHIDVTKNQSLSLTGIPSGVSISAIVDGVDTFVYVSSSSNLNLLQVLSPTTTLKDVNIWFGTLSDTFKSTLI